MGLGVPGRPSSGLGDSGDARIEVMARALVSLALGGAAATRPDLLDVAGPTETYFLMAGSFSTLLA